jgi:hypothetical protein
MVHHYTVVGDDRSSLFDVEKGDGVADSYMAALVLTDGKESFDQR